MKLDKHKFERKFDVKNKSASIDCMSSINELLAMMKEVDFIIVNLQKQLELEDVFKEAQLDKIKLEVAHLQGYKDALEAVAYMAGFDFYFHYDGPCKDAFQELADDPAHPEEQHTWVAGEGSRLINWVTTL